MHKIIWAITLLALSSVSVSAFSASNKQTLCHKGGEISVANPAVSAHLNHGDSVGECAWEYPQPGPGPGPKPEPEPGTMIAVVMLRCEGVAGNGVVVVSVSSSVDGAVIQPLPEEVFDCADVLAELLNADAGFQLRSITSGSANNDENLHLYTDYLLIGKVPADS